MDWVMYGWGEDFVGVFCMRVPPSGMVWYELYMDIGVAVCLYLSYKRSSPNGDKGGCNPYPGRVFSL